MTANAKSGLAKIDGNIKQIANRAKTQRKAIQDTAVLILIHAAQYGDYSRADALVHAMGEGMKQNALVEWFVSFGGLTVGERDDGTKGFTGWSGKAHIKKHLDDAKAKPWYEFKKEKPFEGFELEAAIQQVISKAESMEKRRAQFAAEGDTENAGKIVVDISKLRELRKLAA